MVKPLLRKKRGTLYAAINGGLSMKVILIISVVLMLLAGATAAAGADGVIDLSTLGKRSSEPVALPRLTPTMPTNYTTSYLGSQTSKPVVDLSTLGKKKAASTVPGVELKGPIPVTITPSFSIRNANITMEANTIFTLPQAISANTTLYTPPFAIFGGA
jgi:hypothetical protein